MNKRTPFSRMFYRKLILQPGLIAMCLALLSAGCGVNVIPTSSIPGFTPRINSTSIITKTIVPTLSPSPLKPQFTATAVPSLTPTKTTTPIPITLLNGDTDYLHAGKMAFIVNLFGIGFLNADGSNPVITIDGTREPMVLAFTPAWTATPKYNNDNNPLWLNSITWSPDGQWLAYDQDTDSDPNYRTSQIFIVNKDGEEKKQITNFLGMKDNLAWSPDGQEIAFDDGENIIAVQKDGKYMHMLTSLPGQEIFPKWSPDGKKMAFLYAPGEGYVHLKFEIDIMNLSDGIPRRLINLPVVFGIRAGSWFDWSPDGKSIAFVSPESENSDCNQIFVVNIDGSNLEKTGKMPGCLNWNPEWSPASQYIAFISNGSSAVSVDRDDQVYIMKRDGKGLMPLTSFQREGGVDSFDWSRVPGLRIGQTYTITSQGDKLIVYDEPSLQANKIATLRTNDQITNLTAPIDADNFYWRKVSLSDGTEGYIKEVGGWLAPVE